MKCTPIRTNPPDRGCIGGDWTKHDAASGQVALNWLIHFQGETVVTIPRATKVHQVEESAAAMKFKLSGDELACLDKLSKAYC